MWWLFYSSFEKTTTTFYHLADSMLLTQKNVVVVFSNDESFVIRALNFIGRLSADYRIDVVGMPSWINFSSLPPALLDSERVVITSSFYFYKNSTEAEKFRNAYHDKFRVN